MFLRIGISSPSRRDEVLEETRDTLVNVPRSPRKHYGSARDALQSTDDLSIVCESSRHAPMYSAVPCRPYIAVPVTEMTLTICHLKA